MAGFFKKLIDQVKKEYPDVGELIDSARGGKMKQFLQDQVAEITGMGTPSSQQSYGEMLKQEAEEQQARAKDRAERLKTVYRDPADIEMAAEARRLIKARIKDNLRPRNFLWGRKKLLTNSLSTSSTTATRKSTSFAHISKAKVCAMTVPQWKRKSTTYAVIQYYTSIGATESKNIFSLIE